MTGTVSKNDSHSENQDEAETKEKQLRNPVLLEVGLRYDIAPRHTHPKRL
jgi:hypothetical protein